MPHIASRYLDPVLAPKHASLVDAPDERARLLAAIDEDDETSAEALVGMMSREGRVLVWRLATGERVIYEGEIQVDYDGALVNGWKPVGEPRAYLVRSNDKAEIFGDACRLFLAHSLRTGAVSRFAGWRARVVALIPEEVGAKESKIIRTTADGGIEATHTYNVLDAYGTYAGWIHELAMEFGSTDEALAKAGPWMPGNADEPQVRGIVQAWLMREAADAELAQARTTLNFSLGAHARLLKRGGSGVSIAELARSLYTDRPNLSKIIKAAESDSRTRRLFDAVESGDPDAVLAAYRADS
jgi:hypothetical protein